MCHGIGAIAPIRKSPRCHCRPGRAALAESQITRIVVEPTGGYEKPTGRTFASGAFPVEMIHSSRFKAYRNLVGVKAKSDTSDARLLAAYAAAPDAVRGRKAGHVELPEDAVREDFLNLRAAVTSSST